MNLLKFSKYIIFLGLAILVINFIVVSNNLPHYPTESHFKYYKKLGREEIIARHNSEVNYAYKCFYGRMGYESTCPGGGNLPYFTYFAILLIVTGIILRKSISKPQSKPKE